MTGISNDLMLDYVAPQIAAIAPRRVVDFGAGQGKMGRLVREACGDNVIELIAVEGCAATAEVLRGQAIYDRVDHALLENWIREHEHHALEGDAGEGDAGEDKTRNGNAPVDLAIFGDVLEHLPRREAFDVLHRTLDIASNVIVNVPLRNLHQDGAEGNPLEEHRAYFTERCFDARFICREKHVLSPSAGYAKLNAWIVGRRRFRLKTAIKGHLLRRFGRPAKVALERMGYDCYVSG